MADQVFSLISKTAATTNDTSVVKSTSGMEAFTFQRIVTAITGVGCTFDVKIETTNVADEDLWPTAGYWVDLITAATFGQVTTAGGADLGDVKTVVDHGAFDEPGAFIRVNVAIGTPGTVTYQVIWTYKERVTNS